MHFSKMHFRKKGQRTCRPRNQLALLELFEELVRAPVELLVPENKMPARAATQCGYVCVHIEFRIVTGFKIPVPDLDGRARSTKESLVSMLWLDVPIGQI